MIARCARALSNVLLEGALRLIDIDARRWLPEMLSDALWCAIMRLDARAAPPGIYGAEQCASDASEPPW